MTKQLTYDKTEKKSKMTTIDKKNAKIADFFEFCDAIIDEDFLRVAIILFDASF